MRHKSQHFLSNTLGQNCNPSCFELSHAERDLILGSVVGQDQMGEKKEAMNIAMHIKIISFSGFYFSPIQFAFKF